jgi:hypothetical protein
MVVLPAKSYSLADDLWVISTFYNSNNYGTKLRNFELFLERIEISNLNYLIIECAFNDDPFVLKPSKNILRVRTPDILWQKERLLNIAIQNLPERCKKIAWLDCDVLFENPDWAKETSERLNYYNVVQPYKEAIRLPENTTFYYGIGIKYYGFVYVSKINPTEILSGNFETHGHTGFAWASHKSIFLKHGFYDVCIAGTADHIMAHAFLGDWDTACVKKIIGDNPAFHNHYLNWSKKIYPSIQSKLSYTDGTLLHLWHGDINNRKYSDGERVLEKFMFNPSTDLQLNRHNCWKWNHKNKDFKDWAKEYFVLRKED